jgi:hypothetical protein
LNYHMVVVWTERSQSRSAMYMHREGLCIHHSGMRTAVAYPRVHWLMGFWVDLSRRSHGRYRMKFERVDFRQVVLIQAARRQLQKSGHP